MLCQMYIFNTTIANPILKEAYIANALVNLSGFPFIFFEMNLLLEYQKTEFKQFQFDKGLSLQETNNIF